MSKGSFNTLPIELKEQILNEVSLMDWSTNTKKYALQRCALVCQQWRLMANRLIWKEVDISSIRNKKEFRFYRYITNPNNNKGELIRKLKMGSVKLWPICIGKILQACPNIVELEITFYKYKDTRGQYDLLGNISRLLPNLRILNLELSEDVFGKENIEKFANNNKGIKVELTQTYCPYGVNHIRGLRCFKCRNR